MSAVVERITEWLGRCLPGEITGRETKRKESGPLEVTIRETLRNGVSHQLRRRVDIQFLH